MTGDDRDDATAANDEGTAFDGAVRRMVRALAESAPEPPALPTAGPNQRGRWGQDGRPARHLALAAAAAVVVIAVAAAVLAVTSRRSGDDGPAVDASARSMRHQVLDITIDADLVCDGAIDAGRHTLRVDTWLDDSGERFRQQVQDERGTVADYLNEGPYPYATRGYGRGERDGLVEPACPPPHEWLLNGTDNPGSRSVFPLLNPPREMAGTPSYTEQGALVPGDHTDQLGRPAVVYRRTGDYSTGTDEGQLTAFHTETEWFADPTTRQLLQIIDRGESDGNRVERTMVVSVDETIALDPGVFATEGYTQQFDLEAYDRAYFDRFTAEPIEPTIELDDGSSIWPAEPDRTDPAALGQRFAAEVLGWADAQVTEDGTGNVRVDDGRGHAVVLFVPANPEGASVVQISGAGASAGVGPGPRGDAMFVFHPLEGAVSMVIYARTLDGEMRAWRAPTSADKQYEVRLPDLEAGALGPQLVVLYDADGWAVDAYGSGPMGP